MNITNWSLFGLPRTGKSKTAVLGIVYDSTSHIGKGAAAFPIAIRLATHGIEWEENNQSVHTTNSIDVGDLIPGPDSSVFVKEVTAFLGDLWNEGFRKFLVLGGNHAITIPVIAFLKEKKAVKTYVQFDAHADSRDEDRGTKQSFACTFRRVSEILGAENCSLVGVRSIAEEETAFIKKSNVLYGEKLDMKKVNEHVKRADYVSIDMDVFEHASVTNPEPHSGMTLSQVLGTLSGKKTGIDIVEGIPQKFFGDDTSTAAALIARKALFLLGDKNGSN
ncbi:MAG: hypothetical protein GOV00_01675 [Candidatus Altiarchaeota archaeon]|nr:hypothetical protein [Candidatus Altiarchaeota archaeon]